MAAGTLIYRHPIMVDYIAISIEELLELEFESIDSRGDRFFPL
jgi:hypothetical protein